MYFVEDILIEVVFIKIAAQCYAMNPGKYIYSCRLSGLIKSFRKYSIVHKVDTYWVIYEAEVTYHNIYSILQYYTY